MLRISLPLFIFVVLLVGCSGSDQEKSKSQNVISVADTLGPDEAVVYSLPSPLQVSSVMKMMGTVYDESLINETIGSKPVSSTSESKALFLGACMIDFSYVILSDEIQSHTAYIPKIQQLLDDLGIGYPTIPEELLSKKEIEGESDTLVTIGRKFLKDIEEHFTLAKDKKIPMLVICGMYIEGMYIMTQIYDRQIKGDFDSGFNKNAYENLMLQQQVFLENILELIAPYQKEQELAKVMDLLNLLCKDFTGLKMTFLFDSLQNKIVSVEMEEAQLPALSKRVKTLHNAVVNI
ncbi:MAG: hypothetical protein KKA07_04660 [Bacteroidetes bacterium]|nr:hypothetical protein [Bacteroidota bacterium]MBU1718344.1 hypothetical protein [Bacteroidota bacterium]